MPKIPPQFIVFNPTTTQLEAHSLAYSKKYYLKIAYPDGIEVDAGDSTEATWEHETLTASLPITSELEDSLLGKRKRPLVLAPPKKRAKSGEEQADSPKAKPKKASLTSSPSKSPSQSGKDTQSPEPKSKKSPSKPAPEPQNDEDDAEELQDAEPEESPQVSGKKKKNFPSKENTLDILEQIVTVHEDKISAKLDKQKAKTEWLEGKQAVREKRKQEKLAKKSQERAKAISELQQEKSQAKQQKEKTKPPAAPKLSKPAEPSVKLPKPEQSTKPPKPEKEKEKAEAGSALPKPVAKALTPILKSPEKSSPTKKKVKFSPNLAQVKAIPKVKRNPSARWMINFS